MLNNAIIKCMRSDIELLLQKQNSHFHLNQGILTVSVTSLNEGTDVAKQILYSTVDTRTMLYLSGGSTPKPLYTKLATEEKIIPGGVAMVDERYGEKMHAQSNELMINDTGLLRYFEMRGIPFHPMLFTPHLTSPSDLIHNPSPDKRRKKAEEAIQWGEGKEREVIAQEYDEFVRSSHSLYKKSIAVLGIGADGHTAGIAPNRPGFVNPLFDEQYNMVSSFNDEMGSFKERITFTFLGLSMMDILIVLVFGEEKKDALKKMFDLPAGGRGEEDVPARFFTRADVAKRTIVITDQEI